MLSSTKKARLQVGLSAAVIAVLGIISLTVHLWIGNIRFAEPVALIYQNGELLYEIELWRVSEPQFIDIDNMNKIEIRQGEIGMVQADCPDKLCVHTGFISGMVPIICIPNRLEIRIHNNKSDIDGITR